MLTLPASMTIATLAMLGAHPTGPTAGHFDVLQRELDTWFARGGSCRAFVEARGGVWRTLCRVLRR